MHEKRYFMQISFLLFLLQYLNLVTGVYRWIELSLKPYQFKGNETGFGSPMQPVRKHSRMRKDVCNREFSFLKKTLPYLIISKKGGGRPQDIVCCFVQVPSTLSNYYSSYNYIYTHKYILVSFFYILVLSIFGIIF